MNVRPEAIVSIQKQLEVTIGGSSKGILYLSGEKSACDGMSPLARSSPPAGPSPSRTRDELWRASPSSDGAAW